MSQATRRRRSARVRPYLPALSLPADPEPAPGLLFRVLSGLRALPDHRPPTGPAAPLSSSDWRERRTPLVCLIDAQKTPTEELPVVTHGGWVS